MSEWKFFSNNLSHLEKLWQKNIFHLQKIIIFYLFFVVFFLYFLSSFSFLSIYQGGCIQKKVFLCFWHLLHAIFFFLQDINYPQGITKFKKNNEENVAPQNVWSRYNKTWKTFLSANTIPYKETHFFYIPIYITFVEVV